MSEPEDVGTAGWRTACHLVAAGLLGAVLTLSAIPAQALWRQVNRDGFGKPANDNVSCMAAYQGYVYAASRNYLSGSGMRVLRIPLGERRAWLWESFNGRWSGTYNTECGALAVFKEKLYLGTSPGGQIWRTGGKLATIPPSRIPRPSWKQVTPSANPQWTDHTQGITSLTVLGDYLYAARPGPLDIWRTADGLAWERVASNGFEDPGNNYQAWLAAFGGRIYAGTGNEFPGNAAPGCEVWSSADGTTWRQDNADGFGEASNVHCRALAPFGGRLYVGTTNPDGFQVWRYDGETWEKAYAPCSGLNCQPRAQALAGLRGSLYVGLGGGPGGTSRILSTSDGLNWAPAPGSEGGFGNANNLVIESLLGVKLPKEASHTILGYLYAGTLNNVTGGEVWMKTIWR